MPLTGTVGDVEARWRPLDDEESDVAAVLVADVLAKLRVRRPGLSALIAAADAAAAAPGATQAQIDAAADWRRLVAEVVAGAVIPVLANPDRLRSTTIGSDGSISVGYAVQAQIAEQARVVVSDDMLADIDTMIRFTAGTTRVVSIGLTTWSTTAEPVDLTALPTP